MRTGIADPEKTPTDRQRHDKHISVVKNDHATTEELLEAVFSMRFMLRLYKENQREFLISALFK
jgi:hypothetical protein